MSRHLSTRNISCKSMHAFLSNLAYRQTDRQTNGGKAFTSSFVGGKECWTVARALYVIWWFFYCNLYYTSMKDLVVMTEKQGNKYVKRWVLWTSSKNWQGRCQNDVLCVKVSDHNYQVHCEILMLVTGLASWHVTVLQCFHSCTFTCWISAGRSLAVKISVSNMINLRQQLADLLHFPWTLGANISRQWVTW